MGIVYQARDTHLDRFVAVKVLPPELVADADRKRRFVQEAKAASALNHPNIVTIHEIANDHGMDFIVMEYVTGKTLDRLIPRKGMPLKPALKIAIPMADALAAAHDAGIVHRDFKPSNVMVGESGQVKVLDFGLASGFTLGRQAEKAPKSGRCPPGVERRFRLPRLVILRLTYRVNHPMENGSITAGDGRGRKVCGKCRSREENQPGFWKQ